jgi:3-methyl-2-oxobutanoate hydroxymethyltransferase
MQEAEKLKSDALLTRSRCFCYCTGKIPASLAKAVSESLSIPTIGIGAGGACDRTGIGNA